MPMETTRIETSSAVMTVTLDRREGRNSINGALLRDLHLALDLAQESPECRMVVIAGRDGVFCSGMDFDEASSSAAGAEEGGRLFVSLLKRFTSIPRVVVAAVDGRVTGGGVGLAAACDFVFATSRSQFSLPEALWGLLPCCVLPFLIRRVGFQKAYAMTIGTQPVFAREAAGFHLVDAVGDDIALLVRKTAMRATKLDEATVRAIKAYFGRLWELSPQVEQAAITELTRLMATPLVRRNITNFVHHKRLPWEEVNA